MAAYGLSIEVWHLCGEHLTSACSIGCRMNTQVSSVRLTALYIPFHCHLSMGLPSNSLVKTKPGEILKDTHDMSCRRILECRLRICHECWMWMLAIWPLSVFWLKMIFDLVHRVVLNRNLYPVNIGAVFKKWWRFK